jgi:nicotinate-nucleotide pyrophosphorylase (carboxylating)
MMLTPDIAADPAVLAIVETALREDLAGGADVTTESLVAADREIQAVILTREDIVVSGATVAPLVFQCVDPAMVCRIEVPDGTGAAAGDVLLSLSGPARGILVAERTALNLMQRMCGVATLTRRFVDAVKAYGTEILDTRKTTPGLRVLEKYAVRCGGGSNHRMGLYDRVLMKDNHRGLWRSGLGDDLDQAVQAARQAFPGIPVEIEVETEVELESALRASPEWVLLDNMGPDALARCVQLCGGRSRLEASGGITMENVAAVAQSGVDAISLGCLTHSAPAVDLSLELAG